MPDASIVILEARDRVGGRTYSHEFVGDMFDFGGQWVGTSQPHILKVSEDLGVSRFTQFINGTKVLDINNKISHYNLPIPSTSFWEMLNLAALVADVTVELKGVQREAPWNMSSAGKYDSETVETFCKAFPFTDATDRLVSAMMRVVFGKESRALSSLQLLHYAKCAGGILPILEATKGGGQEFKFNGGAQQISEKLARGLAIRFSDPVVHVAQTGGKVEVSTASGGRIQAGRVVMTAPPHLAASILYDPPLEPKKDHLLRSMTQGHLIKAIFAYDTAFWRAEGFSGEVVSDGDPLNSCFDDTTAAGTAAIICFIGGDLATRNSPLPMEARRDKVLAKLVQYFGEQARQYKGYAEQDWGKEPFTGGCPVGTMDAGSMTQFGDAIRDAHGFVHFAGTETATVWPGFMNGAIQSGQRAAIEVLEGLGRPVPDDWRKFYDMTAY